LNFRKKYSIGKEKAFKFRSPKNNRLLIDLVKLLLPLFNRLIVKVVEIEVNQEELSRLKNLKTHRVILTPNHPALDWTVIFHLSKLAGQDFNYLAAKEVFEQAPPGGAWFLQRLGAYSIVRGTADRTSFMMTRKLLQEGKNWLVIFPEGLSYWLNDVVLAFQQGPAQLAFWALEDLSKQNQLTPLYIVPVAIKYAYLQDMRPEIESSLMRLERKLSLREKSQNMTLYNRLRQVGETVLRANEKFYNLQPSPDASLNDRIQLIKGFIVSRVAEALEFKLSPNQTFQDQIRAMFNLLDRIVHSDVAGSEYEKQLHLQRQQGWLDLYNELWKAQDFIAVSDGYVRESLSAERFLEVLGRLELEVFEKIRIWGPRKAMVKIGEKINLDDYFPRYRQDKRGTLNEVTMLLESSVKQMLGEFRQLTNPVEPLGKG